MRIVDAQVHLWTGGTPLIHHRQVTRFTAEDMLAEMDAAGVDAALIHPPLIWDPASNTYAIEVSRRYPDRFAVLGQLPLDKPEKRVLIKGWRNQPGMLGMRYGLAAPEQQDWHKDGTLDWLWPAAEREGLPIALMAGRFLPEFKSIAERHPGLRLIIDHFGLLPTEQDEAAFIHLDELLQLARLPNVAVKATGAPGYSTQVYPYRNLHDVMHRIFDAFGPRRYFWGTDLTRMPCSYRQCVTLFTEELPWLARGDLELVMGRGLCEWIDWKSAAA